MKNKDGKRNLSMGVNTNKGWIGVVEVNGFVVAVRIGFRIIHGVF